MYFTLLYKIGHITKVNSYSENRQFIKKSVGCKDQMFFVLPFERNLCQTQKKKVFYETKMQKLDFKYLLIASLCIEYIGEFMALNQNGPMPVWGFCFINFLPN